MKEHLLNSILSNGMPVSIVGHWAEDKYKLIQYYALNLQLA